MISLIVTVTHHHPLNWMYFHVVGGAGEYKLHVSELFLLFYFNGAGYNIFLQSKYVVI